MEKKIKISKSNIITILISALVIVICSNLKIDDYLKSIIIPFGIMLISYLIMLRDSKWLNKKAYYLLIPIIFILLSGFVVTIDDSNKMLILFILPVLLSMFFFMLINKNYKISNRLFSWVFKLYCADLLCNFKYMENNNDKSSSENTKNIILGLLVGGFLGIIIISLLVSADDYFGAFINNVMSLFKIDIESIIVFFISFSLLLTFFINLLLNKTTKVEDKEVVVKKISETMIVTVLSMVNVVFVLFLISEISRVTTNFLQLPIEYTYSSYAREGFFQLLAVTVINFSIIVYLLYKTTTIKDNDKIKKLILLLIFFSIALIFNSYYRMFLYISNYGFTILRLQVILFLAMELIIFGVLIKKIVKGLKNNDLIIYFVIMISFFVANIYLCTDNFIRLLDYINF